MEKIIEELNEHDIKQQELFNNVELDIIMPLLSDCNMYEIQKDELLINATEKNTNIYLILSGAFNVLLALDNPEPLTTLGPGQSIGEIAVIDHQPASAYVKAIKTSRVLLIEEEVVWSLIGSSHAIANNLLLVLSQRLRNGNSVIDEIKNLLKEYEHNATIDALTSLYNRRWLDNMLERTMQRCHKNNEALSVMMIDIDSFKNYNDINGHLAGDLALQTVSKTITEHLRPEDLITRYGGEELFVLLPGLDKEATTTIAERLRCAVGETQIQDKKGRPLPAVTISIGIAQMHDQDDAHHLIETADKAMYTAKKSGRNRVCS